MCPFVVIDPTYLVTTTELLFQAWCLSIFILSPMQNIILVGFEGWTTAGWQSSYYHTRGPCKGQSVSPGWQLQPGRPGPPQPCRPGRLSDLVGSLTVQGPGAGLLRGSGSRPARLPATQNLQCHDDGPSSLTLPIQNAMLSYQRIQVRLSQIAY